MPTMPLRIGRIQLTGTKSATAAAAKGEKIH
jgi:hypothetical protein